VFAWPRDLTREEALGVWDSPKTEVFVAELDGEVVGTAFLKPNQGGGGAHVANAGYAVAGGAEGRGVAGALCSHTLEQARAHGFRAMQFNFVVSTNVRAVKLWHRFGFKTAGVLPAAFQHPTAGAVDVYVMFRAL
jgi:GNAT superfamily N-acetyltransferase